MARTIPVTVLSNAVTDTHDFRVLITDVRPRWMRLTDLSKINL